METLVILVYGVVYVKSHPRDAYITCKDEVKMGEYLREEEKKRKVLIINTGGTIGSKYTDQGIVVLLPPNR